VATAAVFVVSVGTALESVIALSSTPFNSFSFFISASACVCKGFSF